MIRRHSSRFFKQGDIPIYAHQRVIENLEKRFDYIFETVNKYPGAPSVKPIEVINNHPFSIGNKMAIPINVMHGKLQAFGYRIDDFAYLTDVKTVEESEIEKLKNLKVLVVNALREEPHKTHFNLQEALDFIALIQPQRPISLILAILWDFTKKCNKNFQKTYI